jgi:hypothetical protein
VPVPKKLPPLRWKTVPPQKHTSCAVPRVWEYTALILRFSVPLLGLIPAFIFAFGKHGHPKRRSLACAFLMIWAGIALTAASIFHAAAMGTGVFRMV